MVGVGEDLQGMKQVAKETSPLHFYEAWSLSVNSRSHRENQLDCSIFNKLTHC